MTTLQQKLAELSPERLEIVISNADEIVWRERFVEACKDAVDSFNNKALALKESAQ